MQPSEPVLRRLTTSELTAAETRAIRELLRAAFEDDGEGFTDVDWAHSVGGVHVVLSVAGNVVAHASLVERELRVAGLALRTGYVEAVATRPELQGRGYGSRVMTEINDTIRNGFELGALSTGTPDFYGRLGWKPWRGPTAVRTEGGLVRTPDDDGGIMVLLTPASPELDLAAPISCPWRDGDVW
jgi:aminoglycoside 2'-N-acetyltransferase I